MNRNVESRFAVNPTSLDMPRSRFARPQSHKTTFNVGDIVPFYIEEVLPGDTHSIDTSYLVRMQTLVNPIMDNIYLDTYYFFVPNRLVWEHWKQFMGENTDGAWIPQVEYSVPQIKCPTGGWNVGTIADYFGIPTEVDLGNTTVNALPFRAYAMICNEFFRDENLTDYLNIPLGDSTQTGSNGSNYVNDVANGGLPFKASKYHDYFTSALPAPQKGPEVSLNLSNLPESIPVVGNGHALALVSQTNHLDPTGRGVLAVHGAGSGTDAYVYSGVSSAMVGDSVDPSPQLSGHKAIGVALRTMLGENDLDKSGLIADLRSINTDSLITINQLRQAFQIQKFMERDARSGTRYIEVLKAHFGVNSPDARLQRPEYLGGARQRININQVVQTSETSASGTPQGNTTAFSLTTNAHSDFTRSFVEHGFIIGLCVARYDHTYQQGIERFFRRKDKYDYYWPLFANLGEQGIKVSEIYAQGSSVVDPDTNVPYDDEIFGYQEAWAEYRYKPNRVSGEMRSSYQTSLDSWHLADYYASMPYLSDAWIREDKSVVDRALAVTSNVSAQLFGDFYVQDIATRCMPLYSVPGLIDHH